MQTKQQIIDALQLAVRDHKATAGAFCDWDFVSALRAAEDIVAAAPETTVPCALAEVSA